MTGVTIVGWSTLAAAGRAPVGGLDERPFPVTDAHALTGLDARARLGRKGTSTYDRATALAVICAQETLAAAGTTLDETTRDRAGVVLGTTAGSMASTSDFCRDSLVGDKPYQVNPLRFPNAVLNYAAGQVAIRFGLRGVNATIAGTFLDALRYAAGIIARGYAELLLTGGVEEYTPHRAWAARLTGSAEAGEAAGMFALAGPRPPAWAGRHRSATVLSVVTGYGPGGSADRALRGCVGRAVRRAGVRPDWVCIGDDDHEYGPVVDALGYRPERVRITQRFGDCGAASGAVALATALDRSGPGRWLLTARGADGSAGAAVMERYADGSADRW
jgi:3-oxoacyl-[acyl-carrier-protein] synthase II